LVQIEFEAGKPWLSRVPEPNLKTRVRGEQYIEGKRLRAVPPRAGGGQKARTSRPGRTG